MDNKDSDNSFYKTIAKKSNIEIMFIIENPEDYQKEFYYAAVEIGLQRGIISKSDFDEVFLRNFNENITEIVAKENAKPQKPFNHLLNGVYFLAGGIILYILNLSSYNRFIEDYFGFSFVLTSYIAILISIIFFVIGLFKKIKKIVKQN